jgi:hypothetical protein
VPPDPPRRQQPPGPAEYSLTSPRADRLTLPKAFGVRVPPKAGPEEPTRPDLPLNRPRVPLQAPELDTLPPVAAPQRPLHAQHRPGEQTLVGGFQPAPGSRLPPVSAPPPRSFSPSPESIAAQVKIGGVELPPIRKRHLRTLWVWVGPVVVSLLGTAYGYVRGYAKGLADAAERLAAIEARGSQLGKRVASDEVRLEAVENAEAAEETRNRAERATALRKLDAFATDLEDVKRGMPKIQGLQTKKP